MNPKGNRPVTQDPCEPIQADLSCMMDGELEPAAVRRVLVHLEVCPRCRDFFGLVRSHVQAHRSAWAALERGVGVGRPGRPARLSGSERRLHLARIFYELGKAYVLLTVSPGFRREVASEPVPIPAAARDLSVDPGGRQAAAGGETSRWIQAEAVLSGHLESRSDNLGKGIALLEESLAIQSRLFEARIYLGHARNLQNDLEGACEEFRTVLRDTKAIPIRGYALENLGSAYLQMGALEDAARCFRRVVHGEVLAEMPRFSTSWYNLGLVYALQGFIEESLVCFRELYEGFPERRPAVAEIVASSRAMRDVLAKNPEMAARMRVSFPAFFEGR